MPDASRLLLLVYLSFDGHEENYQKPKEKFKIASLFNSTKYRAVIGNQLITTLFGTIVCKIC